MHMNTAEALEALSLIDLPAPRRAYIARLAVSATPAERRRIVYRARRSRCRAGSRQSRVEARNGRPCYLPRG